MLLKKRNLRKFKNKLENVKNKFSKNKIKYNQIYDFLEGWMAYSQCTNSYKLRQKILEKVKEEFKNEISTKEMNRYLKVYNCKI